MLIVLAWSNVAFCGEIHDAAKNGDLEKVRALLKANPDLVNSKDTNSRYDGYTPLHSAVEKRQKEMVELLLANKADVNANVSSVGSPLHLAAARGYMDMVELLLAKKAKVNAKNNDGDTPCIWQRVMANRMWWNYCASMVAKTKWPRRPTS